MGIFKRVAMPHLRAGSEIAPKTSSVSHAPLALALEPRFMFDAAGGATAVDAAIDQAAQDAADAAIAQDVDATPHDAGYEVVREAAPALNDGRKEVVFIDGTLADRETLINGVGDGAEVIVLDGQIDGLTQIAAWADTHTGFDAIHILSHGAEGRVYLGTMTLDRASVEARAADLATVGAALTKDGDILLYGCHVASGDGQVFAKALAQATGADVAASTDPTGADTLGGDWDLEYAAGPLESTPYTLSYGHLLATDAMNSATASGGTVTSAVDGVSYTISSGGNSWLASSAFSPAPNEADPNVGGSFYFNINQSTYTFTFASAVSITSVGLIDLQSTASNGANLTFSVTDGSGNASGLFSTGTMSDLVISGSSYKVGTATLNWTNVTSFTASGASGKFGFDNLVATAAPTTQAPTLTATGGTPTFTENGSAVDLFSGITAATNDSGQTFTGAAFTVSNVQTSDVLAIDGKAISLTHGATGVLTSSGSYSVSVAAGTATITLSGMTNSNATMNTIIDGMTFRNTSESPSTTNRAVTITSLTDSGSQSVSPNTVSTVTMNSIADATGASIAAGTYKAGGTIDTTVTFDQAVTVNTTGGTPTLALDIGGVTKQASYVSGTGTTNLVFRYTVLNGDTDTDGVTANANGITLNGGTIRDTAVTTDTAALLYSAVTNAAAKVDTTAPATPSAPDMTAGTDSGTTTDNITNDTTPTFTGTAEAGSTVKLYNGATLLGSATATAGTWSITSSALTAGTHSLTATATDAAGNASAASSALSVTIDNVAPTVTDAHIAISGASGTGGTYRIGDTLTATWNNTATGDNNSDTIASATVNFSALGGGAAVAATNSSGTWTASYTIAAVDIDATNRNIAFTATDTAGNVTTTADTTNASADSVAPTVTDAHIAISGASGTGGAYKIGDTVTATWDNTLAGDNNSDTIASATVNFSALGGGAAVAATNSSGTWTATYTIAAGAIEASNLNVSVTATDNAGNATTQADTSNATVDAVAPGQASGTLSVAENAANTTAVGTVTASGAASYSLTDTAGGRFAISAGGAVTVANGSLLNYESATSHNITVRATDSAGNTTDKVLAVAVSNVNETPLNTIPGTQAATEDTPLVIGGGAISVADPDSGAALTTTLTVTGGTVAVTTGGGATITNDGTATVTIAGSATQVNAALNSITFTPTANLNGTGAGAIQVATSDGTLTDTDTITINLAAVADTPSVTNTSTTPSTQTTSGLVLTRNAGDGAEVTHFKITSITNGTLYQNDGTTAISNGAFITHAQGAAGLKFTPSGSGNGSFIAQASTSAIDGGLGGSTVTATIDVGIAVTSATIAEDTTSQAIVLTRSDAGQSHFKLTNITLGKVYSDAGLTTEVASNGFVALAGATTTVYFVPTANANGTGGFSAQATTNGADSGLTANVAASTVTITAVNDAPVMAAASPTLTGMTEDQSAIGNVISSFISLTDPDSGALAGIAITGTTGNGAWSYWDGAAWNAVGAVSESSALLLRSDYKIGYTPDGSNGETPTLTYRGWDRTSGAVAGKVDVTTNGNATAFSTQSNTASLAVSSVNDAPTNPTAPALTATNEDTAGPTTAVTSMLTGVTDVDTGATVGIAVTGLTGNGTWQYTANGGTTWTALSVSAATSATLLDRTWSLRYQPDGKNGGTATLSYRAWDGSSGTAGGSADASTGGTTTAFSANAATISQSVTTLNDAPTVSTAVTAVTATEDVAFSYQLPAGAFADVDTGDTLTLTATLANGSALPAWLTFTAGTRTFSGTPANGDVGALSVKVTATDGSNATATQTFSLTTTNVNDAPSDPTAPVLAATNEDTAGPVATVASLVNNATDVDTGTTIGAAVTGLTGRGAWQYSADGGTSWTNISGVSATTAVLLDRTWSLRYRPDSINGETAALTYRAWDGSTGTAGGTINATTGGGTTALSAATATLSQTVTPVNDAPTVDGAPPTVSLRPGDAWTYTVPATLVQDPEGGTLTWSATTATGAPLPGWITFDAVTRTFTGTAATMPPTDLKVVATDASGASGSATFSVSVAAPPVEAPAATPSTPPPAPPPPVVAPPAGIINDPTSTAQTGEPGQGQTGAQGNTNDIANSGTPVSSGIRGNGASGQSGTGLGSPVNGALGSLSALDNTGTPVSLSIAGLGTSVGNFAGGIGAGGFGGPVAGGPTSGPGATGGLGGGLGSGLGGGLGGGLSGGFGGGAGAIGTFGGPAGGPTGGPTEGPGAGNAPADGAPGDEPAEDEQAATQDEAVVPVEAAPDLAVLGATPFSRQLAAAQGHDIARQQALAAVLAAHQPPTRAA